MALAVDAVSSATGTGFFTTGVSFSHTCSGSDRLLVCGVSLKQAGSNEVASITYNGTNMTFLDEADEGSRYVAMYYLIAPATGSNTLAITLQGAGESDIGAGAISFTGADQSTPLGTPAKGTGTSSTPSISVTSAADELVLDTLSMEAVGTLSVGAGQTARWNAQATNNFIKYAGSTEPGASSVTMSWSMTSSQGWALMGVSVKPVAAAGGGTTSGNLLLLGVG